MNHRSSGLLISDAIEGLLLAKLAEDRSPRTVTGYWHYLRVSLDYAGDKDVARVTSQEIQAFLLIANQMMLGWLTFSRPGFYSSPLSA
jgi:hypothetical protein